MKMHPRYARKLLAGLSLAMGAGFVLPALAMPPGGGHGMMMAQGAGGPLFGGMLQRMLDRVNATPQQRTQIEQILKSNADEAGAQREAGRALREQAMALFAQPTVDADALEALRQKQVAMHAEHSRRISAAILEISRVLTPEQRKQIAEYMAQRREMMQRHQRERRGLDPAKG